MLLRLPDPPLTWTGGKLRPWREMDAPRLVTAWSDPEIARWNPVPADPTPEQASRWIDGCDARLAAGRALDLCVVDPDDDAVLGELGLSGFDSQRGAALIGYWLLPQARGLGHAVSATSALTEWALQNLSLQVVVARCASANLASHQVALRAGYSHAHSDGTGYELYVRRSPSG